MSSVKLTILDRKETPKNTYVLSVEWEHGDADTKTDRVINFPVNNPKRMELLPLLVDILERGDDYEDSLDYAKEVVWGDEGTMHDYLADGDFWPMDVIYEGTDERASISDYILSYFDENGVERDVKVEHLN